MSTTESQIGIIFLAKVSQFCCLVCFIYSATDIDIVVWVVMIRVLEKTFCKWFFLFSPISVEILVISNNLWQILTQHVFLCMVVNASISICSVSALSTSSLKHLLRQLWKISFKIYFEMSLTSNFASILFFIFLKNNNSPTLPACWLICFSSETVWRLYNAAKTNSTSIILPSLWNLTAIVFTYKASESKMERGFQTAIHLNVS